MRRARQRPRRSRLDEEFLDSDMDQYSEHFDEEEALERGWKPSDLGFMMGFRRA